MQQKSNKRYHTILNNTREQNTDVIETINVQCMLIDHKYLNEDFQLVVEAVY